MCPSLRQAIDGQFFERIFARVVSETGLDDFNKTAPEPVFALADSMGPREFGKRSAMAVGRALAGNRREVTADDFFVIVSAAHDRRIGFV